MATVRTGDRVALLVIDVQAGVVARVENGPGVVGRVARTVERARSHDVPVIWIQHEDEDLPPGSAAWELASGLEPRPGEPRLRKRYNSAFEETELERELERLGAARVVIAGLATNWCVRATAYAALDRGFDLTLVRDAHSTQAVDLGDGRRVEAAAIVAELNATFDGLAYPGLRVATATAEDVDFGPRGHRTPAAG